MRTDLNREIYAESIYGENCYVYSVPGERRDERLSNFPEVVEKLVARGASGNPKM